ncbi:MAG: hypothetical protein L6Q99_00330 [Planctomycetes bacterium]|nr:hypothetical protein [Planctomycetota bacterium]
MIEFEHPRLVWLALAPLALWLFVFVARAREAPSGTVEVWRELERSTPRARRRGWTNWRLWVASAALVAVAFALASPVRRGASPTSTWRVLVDGSPSMFLPWADRGTPAVGAPTRLERALELASEWLEARRAGGERLVWVRWSAGRFEEVAGAEPPSAWLVAEPSAEDQPPFERCDAAGWVWLTDRSRDARFAGVFASGGVAVPGVIGETTSELVELSTDRASGAQPELGVRPKMTPSIAFVGDPPPLVREFVETWASARALTLSGGPVALTFETVASASSAALGDANSAALGAGPGWRVRGRAASLALEPGEREWLVESPGSDGARVLVAWRPGHVRSAWTACDEPEGDPALFAVAWSDLLDAARLSAPEVVACAERAAAGDSGVREPTAPPLEPRPVVERWSRELALLAAVLALLLLG